MKIYTLTTFFLGAILSAMSIAGCAGSPSAPPETAAAPSENAVPVETTPNEVATDETAPNEGAQKMTIVVNERGYTPATVKVKAGQPVQLTFDSQGESCGNTVVIPALDKTVKLKVGEKKTINFTPQAGQTIAFACSMKMFKGEVVAR